MKVEVMIIRNHKTITQNIKSVLDKKKYKNIMDALPISVLTLTALDVINNKVVGAESINAFKIVAAGNIGDGPITNAFMKAGMPILYDLGTVIFVVTCTFGFYAIIRKQVKQGVERLKWAAVGFIGLKSLELFIKLVNIAVSTALKNAG